MFGWEFPPHNSGGLGVACFGLTRALAENQLQITFVLPKRLNVDANFTKLVFADNSVNVTELNSMLFPYATATSYLERTLHKDGNYGNNLFEEVCRYAINARGVAQKEDFEVIHAHDWLAFLAGVEAKKLTGKPLVVHVHATEFDRSGEHVDQRIYDIEKYGMEQADLVVAVSNYTKQIIISRYGIPESKIEVVWNGIEERDYPEIENPYNNIIKLKDAGYKVVLFVGRITMQKGADYFLQAAKRVLECQDKVIFIIAGAGDMEHQIIQQAAHLQISDKVMFTGFLRGDDLTRMYRTADLFVLSSVSEPFGITPLESLINGTPVLVSKQSGISEALTHALKADFWDIDDMADKILGVVVNMSLKQCLGDNGKLDAKRLSWSEAAKKVSHLYERLVTGFKPAITVT